METIRQSDYGSQKSTSYRDFVENLMYCDKPSQCTNNDFGLMITNDQEAMSKFEKVFLDVNKDLCGGE